MTARVIAHPKLGARLVETVIRRAEAQWSDPSEHPEYRALMSLGEKAPPKPRSQAVKPVTPREAVDALCDRLASQRDALDAQIAGLRLATTASN